MRYQITTMKSNEISNEVKAKVLNPFEISRNISKIISQFENGEQRFAESALVNKCIQSLARGSDSILMISDLCKGLEDVQKQCIELTNLIHARPITIRKEETIESK